MADWIGDDHRPVEEVAAGFGISDRTSGEIFRMGSTSRTGWVACIRGAPRVSLTETHLTADQESSKDRSGRRTGAEFCQLDTI